MRKSFGALIGALVVSLAIVAAATADQGNLTAVDANNAEYTDVNGAKVRIQDQNGTAPVGVLGHLGLYAVRIRTGEQEGVDGLIQAGWISSHTSATSLAFDDCIAAGTVVRGYFVEWRNTGIGQDYHCQYWPVSAAKYGLGSFEIIEPSGTWRVVKDGKNILTGLTLNFLQGKASLVAEFAQFDPVQCLLYAQYGFWTVDGQVGDEFQIRRTGGAYQVVTGVSWVYDLPQPGDPRVWTAGFSPQGGSYGAGITTTESVGYNGC